jgi:hypothetical protein
LEIQRELGDAYGSGFALLNMAGAAFAQGHADRARELLLECLSKRHHLGDQAGIVICCGAAAAVLAALQRIKEAALSLHGALALARQHGYTFDAEDQWAIDFAQAAIQQAVGDSLISPEEAAGWEADGAGLQLSELAEHSLASLRTAAS